MRPPSVTFCPAHSSLSCAVCVVTRSPQRAGDMRQRVRREVEVEQVFLPRAASAAADSRARPRERSRRAHRPRRRRGCSARSRASCAAAGQASARGPASASSRLRQLSGTYTLRPPNESSAPALTRHSTAPRVRFLLSVRAKRSASEVNGPPSRRASSSSSIGACRHLDRQQAEAHAPARLAHPPGLRQRLDGEAAIRSCSRPAAAPRRPCGGTLRWRRPPSCASPASVVSVAAMNSAV